MKPSTYLTTCFLACSTLLSNATGSDLLSLIKDRNEKEASVWRQERLAQEHEKAFIRLWDELRSAAEPESVLQAFRFSRIKLGDLSDPISLDNGIETRTMGSAKHDIPWQQWSDWLGQLKEKDYSRPPWS